MAASLCRKVTTQLKLVCVALQQSQNAHLCKNYHLSHSKGKSRAPNVCLSPDKSMIMCWHPESDFPYDHTQPLPRDRTQLEEGDSVLKVQHLVDEKLKNRPEGPTVNELVQLFHTTKEEFKRRPRHAKKTEMVKNKPKDREGL